MPPFALLAIHPTLIIDQSEGKRRSLPRAQRGTPLFTTPPAAPPVLDRTLGLSPGVYSDAVADARGGEPRSDDVRRKDGVERTFLLVPEQAAPVEFRLDGLGGGSLRLAKSLSVGVEMTCIIRVGGERVEATGKHLRGGEMDDGYSQAEYGHA